MKTMWVCALHVSKCYNFTLLVGGIIMFYSNYLFSLMNNISC